jgi:hypothetical protein
MGTHFSWLPLILAVGFVALAILLWIGLDNSIFRH